MDTIQFQAIVGAEQVIRPPAGVHLPRGTLEVTVRVASAEPHAADPLASTRDWLLALAADAERAGPDQPADLAENHDHYAHGKPLP